MKEAGFEDEILPPHDSETDESSQKEYNKTQMETE
jgi:hypothetical protein